MKRSLSANAAFRLTLANALFCLLFAVPGTAQLSSRPPRPEAAPKRYAAGAVVGQFAGRFVMNMDGTGEVIGYFPTIEGVGTNLFAGTEKSEKTAFFSVRSSAMKLTRIPNGTFNHFLLAAATDGGIIEYRVYYHASPNRSFATPATFSEGRLIATFEVNNGMVTVTPTASLYTANMELVDTQDFQYAARTLDLAKFGDSVAVQITGALIPTTLTATGASVPLTGTLTAVQ